MEENLRKKLAVELHDEIGRDLTAISMNLAIISSSMTDEASRNLSARVLDSKTLIKGISGTVRGIMAGLRPPVLDDFGLLAALRWHAGLFSTRTGIAVSVQADKPFPRLTVERETSLFRISQEALMNAAKHADTRVVTISLRIADGMIWFTIVDEGSGFTSASSTNKQDGSGWGMTIMRERAELIGGNFHVDSAPGKGTVVSVNVPLEDN
jgi:signal transduction histidine kinase